MKKYQCSKCREHKEKWQFVVRNSAPCRDFTSYYCRKCALIYQHTCRKQAGMQVIKNVQEYADWLEEVSHL